MSEPKSRLGQGLDDLMGEADPGSSDTGLTELPLDAITPNPAQPRDRFDPDKLEELTNSIRQQGVVEPVLVRPHPEGEAPYQLVAGERRWRAAAQAGLDRLPAVIRDLSSEQALVVSLVENIQRENLGPLEEARAYRRLLDRDAMSQKELGEKLGKSRSAIANRLRLLELPEAIRVALHEGDLSAGHARALLGCDSEEEALRGFERIREDGLTVREIERWVARQPETDAPDASDDKPGSGSESPPRFRRLESRLEEAVGAPVRVESEDRRSGNIIIQFNSPEDFERLQNRLERLADRPGDSDPSGGAV